MPKPFGNLTGNGCHMHMSLWDGETNVFLEDREKDARGMGLSEKGYQFLAGLKKHAKAYIALTAPSVNSYKRLVIGAPTSGATWAPAYVSYGWNNRTMMLRIPAEGRIEDRTVDGACNPYLAATAVLAAGLDGIENGLDPGEPTNSNMYETSEEDRKKLGIETLPPNLLDATRELEERRGASRSLRLGRRRGLRRLLHPLQTSRVAAGSRADHQVGDRPLPAARVRARFTHVRHRRTVQQVKRR